VIAQSGAFRVVADTGDGTTALALIRQHRPRMAVLDIEMPGMTGLAIADAVREEALGADVVLLTMHDEPSVLDRALRAGVRGYVLKDGALTDIVTCLNLVSAGRSYVSPSLTGHLVERRERADADADTGSAIMRQLTPTELRILRLIAANMTTISIARELDISPKTVENHRTRIGGKLDVHGPQALLRFALEHRDALT
jgi:DNA-binding NarL/FixJ family response regulator